MLLVLSSPFAVAFPKGMVTVGDLALATLPPDHEGAARKPWSDGEVWEKLRTMVAEDLGVKLEEVVPTARLVEDLGGG